MVEWITANWVNVLAAVGAIDAALYAITKLTPTQADDNFYTMVHNFVLKFFPKK